MTQFIHTTDGYINLSRVVKIYRRDDEIQPRADYRDIDDKVRTAQVYGADDELSDLTSTVLPAAAGTFATIIYSGVGNEPPTIDDLEVQRHPVVAWRIDSHADALPVLAGWGFELWHIWIELPEGRLHHIQTQRVCNNLADAKNAALAIRQERIARGA